MALSTLPFEAGPLDLATGTLSTARGPVALTETELALVAYLREHHGRPVGPDELLERVWGYRPGVRSRTVEVTVQRLRAKIEVDPRWPRHLVTVRGEGYRLVLPDAPAPHRPFPALLEPLVGRDSELQAVRRKLAGARWLTIVGPHGVGKSWLARAAVDDGLYLELGDVRTPADLGEALGGSPDRPGIWVLDQADALEPDAIAVLERHLRDDPRLKLLATAPGPLGGEGEQVFPLAPLSVDATAELLRSRLEAAGTPPPDRLAELAARLEGLPLAVDLAVPLLAVADPDAVDLAALGRVEHPRRGRSLAEVADLALARLDAESAATLRRWCAFRSTFSLDAARAVAPEVDPIPVLARLVRRSLVRRHPDGRFSVAALIRVGAGAPSPEVARALAGWLAGEHRRLKAAYAPFSELRPHRADLVALLGRSDLDGAHVAHLGHLLCSLLVRYGPIGEVDALEGAFDRAEGVIRASLASRLATIARVRGDWPAAERWAALGLDAGPDLHIRIQLLHSLTASAVELGDLPLARIRAQEALDLAEPTGDTNALASALEAMAATIMADDPAAALPLFDRQVALAEAVANPDNAIVAEINGAWCALALGRWDDALARAGSAVARGSDSARLHAMGLGVRGLTLAILDRDDEARSDLEQALALAAPFPGDPFPGLREGLALLARRSGDEEAVRRHLEQAFEVLPSVAAILDR